MGAFSGMVTYSMEGIKEDAEGGDAEAQYNLGILYQLGECVPEDWPEAREWYRKAAGQGHAKAQLALGVLYQFDNKYGLQDLGKASYWYRRVAEQGDPVGQLLLDELTERKENMFNFQTALSHLENGRSVYRMGWKGGMVLILVPGSSFAVTEGRPFAKVVPVGTNIEYQPHIDIKTEDGSFVPWTPSQTDLLASDWGVVE